MSDPIRMIHDDADDLEAALLRSAQDDSPPSSAQRRVMVRLGLASGVTATAIAATGAAGAATKGAASVASALAVKVISATLVVASLGGASALLVRARHAHAPLPGSSTVVSTGATVRAAIALPHASPTIAAAPSSPAPDDRAERIPGVPVVESRHGATLSPAKGRARPHALPKEVEVLQRARNSLAAGDAATALAALDAYDQAHPAGQLAQEATVLRIEALVRVGRLTSARSLAKAFLAKNPTSPVAPKVRETLASITASDGSAATNP